MGCKNIHSLFKKFSSAALIASIAATLGCDPEKNIEVCHQQRNASSTYEPCEFKLEKYVEPKYARDVIDGKRAVEKEELTPFVSSLELTLKDETISLDEAIPEPFVGEPRERAIFLYAGKKLVLYDSGRISEACEDIFKDHVKYVEEELKKLAEEYANLIRMLNQRK